MCELIILEFLVYFKSRDYPVEFTFWLGLEVFANNSATLQRSVVNRLYRLTWIEWDYFICQIQFLMLNNFPFLKWLGFKKTPGFDYETSEAILLS